MTSAGGARTPDVSSVCIFCGYACFRDLFAGHAFVRCLSDPILCLFVAI
jgi:hypothetical protein